MTNLINRFILHTVNNYWQKFLAVTELCSQCNSNTNSDTGQCVECTLCSGWIHLTECNFPGPKFGLLTSSANVLYACQNGFNSIRKLALTAAEVHCLKKVIVNCLNHRLCQPRTYADILCKQVPVTNCDKVFATSGNFILEIELDCIPESLNGKERLLFDVKLVTEFSACLETTSAHCFLKIKRRGARR